MRKVEEHAQILFEPACLLPLSCAVFWESCWFSSELCLKVLSLWLYKIFKLILWSNTVVIQSLSHVRLFETPWTAACQASLSVPISQSFLMFIESSMPSNYLVLCHPLLLLPSIFASIRGFSNELALHIRWPKYWSFSFNISPSNEYSGLMSFSIDRFDLLAVHGSLKSLLQHHSS